MPLALYQGKLIFFAHVPKTGGSSVEDYLIQRFCDVSLIDRNKREGVSGTGLIIPSTHLSAVDLRELIPSNLDFNFAVVREPLARLMSEFRYQSGVSRMSNLGFSAWLKVMLKAAKREPRLYQNHIRPQSDLVPEDSEVFKLEDGFAPLIKRLDEVVGETIPDLTVPHLNTRKKESIELSVSDIEAVTEFYRNDYERFGYDHPNPDEHPTSSFDWKGLLAPVLARALVAKQRRDWVK